MVLITTQALKVSLTDHQSSRQLWLWTQGIATITLIHHFWKDKPTLRIRATLIQFNCYPHNYHYDRLRADNSVYLKLHPCHKTLPPNKMDPKSICQNTYWGSAKNGMTTREHNRHSKLKQLLLHTITKCELAVRYWHEHGHYHHWITIVVTVEDTHHQALATEHTQTALTHSTLNYPILDKSIIKKASGFRSVTTESTTEDYFFGTSREGTTPHHLNSDFTHHLNSDFRIACSSCSTLAPKPNKLLRLKGHSEVTSTP